MVTLPSHQSPITNYQSPITNHQSPVPSPQSPVPSPQRCTELVEVSPVPNHQFII
ncbi:hypothetical protein H6F47_26720 [Sphaerospermopsis sp. FACHB-1094]|uniref:hypothetical protein n=1 Tax=Sphaerospermopsis sp. FACHB-1094 TaxID=2692861 RepID=UPI00168949EF|nr:hypothetical protein [Sphaerospermopsis sp. FACHB-1094]MBD2135896.1 hypothetical protein [Sphaerospermopsis sp. FACHB-1094]